MVPGLASSQSASEKGVRSEVEVKSVRYQILFVLLLTMFCFAGCTSAPSFSSPTTTGDDRPTKAELFSALEKATQVELYSVDPEYGPGHKATGPQFMNFTVLGSVPISGQEKSGLVAAFEKGIDEKTDTMEAGCFDPHHGLLVRVDGKEYRVIICYMCLQVYARRTGQQSEQDLKLLTTGSPNSIFSKLCVDHKLPVKKGP